MYRFPALPPIRVDLPRPVSPGCLTDDEVEKFRFPPTYLSDRAHSAEARRLSFSVASAPTSIPTSAWRVEPGHFIAFCLDKSYVAASYPRGSPEQQSVLDFPMGRYIGLVLNSFMSKDETDGQLIEELVVQFIARGPPPLPEAASYATRVAPCAPGPHDDFAPLSCSTLFPWPDRMVWTTLGTRLRVSHVHESKLRFQLSEEEYERYEARVADDFTDFNRQLGTNPGFAEVIDTLRVPMQPLPAIVWRDVRGEHQEDPTKWVEEVYALDSHINAIDQASEDSAMDCDA